MGKPTIPPPTWATDANFVDPGKPWDGQPTKVAPLAGVQAQGHLPAKKPAAEYENYVKNAAGEWLAYLANFIAAPQHAALDFTNLGSAGNVALSAPVSGASPPADVLFWKFTGGDSLSSRMPYAVPGFRIATVTFRVKDENSPPVGGDRIVCYLMRQKRDGSTDMEQLVTLNHVFAVPGAVWEDAVMVANHDIEAGYEYWLAVLGMNHIDFLGATVTPG